jgi:hypothetical protein
MIEANQIKTLSERNARTKATEILQGALAYEKKVRMQADMLREKILDNASTRLDVAKDKSYAFKTECNAERVHSNNMQPMREHDQRMGMSDSLMRQA